LGIGFAITVFILLAIGFFGNIPIWHAHKTASDKNNGQNSIVYPWKITELINDGTECFNKNDYNGAITKLAQYLDRCQDSETAHELISYAYAKLCQYALAAEHAEKSIMIDKERYYAYIAIAICCENASDWDRLLSVSNAAISVDNSKTEGHYYACIAYAKKGHNKSAYEEYLKIRNIDLDLAKQLELFVSIFEDNNKERYEERINTSSTEPDTVKVRCLTALDLNASATKADIKHAYRNLVKVWHPDRFAHDPKLQVFAQNKLKEINEAYQYLTA
jgi:Tfp pilus assembly protein PilF